METKQESEPKEISEEKVNSLLSLIIKPLIIVIIFDIAALFNPNASTLIIAGNLGLFTAIGIRASYIQKCTRQETIIAGIISGLVIGFIIGVIQLIQIKKFWTVFGLITQPTIWLIAGALVTGCIWYISKKFNKNK